MSTASPVSKTSQTPQFASHIAKIRKEFFSRDSRRWPIFADPALADVIHFRGSHLPPDDRLAAYPNGLTEYDELRQDSVVPSRLHLRTADQVLDFDFTTQSASLIRQRN